MSHAARDYLELDFYFSCTIIASFANAFYHYHYHHQQLHQIKNTY